MTRPPTGILPLPVLPDPVNEARTVKEVLPLANSKIAAAVAHQCADRMHRRGRRAERRQGAERVAVAEQYPALHRFQKDSRLTAAGATYKFGVEGAAGHKQLLYCGRQMLEF
jgi:hypothetical protein